jgi:hypothetical protein
MCDSVRCCHACKRDLPCQAEPLRGNTGKRGDLIAITEYLGTDAFDNAVADFSSRYADQNQRDYDTFVKAIADGRIQAVTGV